MSAGFASTAREGRHGYTCTHVKQHSVSLCVHVCVYAEKEDTDTRPHGHIQECTHVSLHTEQHGKAMGWSQGPLGFSLRWGLSRDSGWVPLPQAPLLFTGQILLPVGSAAGGWGLAVALTPALLSAVNFDHFQILRAIGKGSFGKVGTMPASSGRVRRL